MTVEGGATAAADQEALDWVYTVTGKRVTRVRRLRGGLTSDVRAVTLAGGETLVLRRYTAWGREAAEPVVREAATLERLVHSDLPAPRLVAARPEGDVPMLLMTRVPGRIWLTPPDPENVDTAHCRLNLAVLFSIDHAERFRVLYEAESGRKVDPWWDLRGIGGYGQDWKQFIPVQVAGRTPVDAAGMDDRIEGLMERILSRM